MENIICIDASILFDYYRKLNKEKTFFLEPYLNPTAINILRQLLCISKYIEYKGLLLVATALHYDYLATKSKKYFINIEGLKLTTPRP